MKYTLQKTTRCCSNAGQHYFGIGENQILFTDVEEYNLFLQFSLIFKKGFSLDLSSIREKLDFLSDEKIIQFSNKIYPFLIACEDNEKIHLEDRYSRNILYYSLFSKSPFFVQSNIESKHVTILGCGGIGNLVSHILATSGVKKITLIDDDVIELSNLTRQIMFTEDDLGRKKTSILKNQLIKRNPSIFVDEINAIVTGEESVSCIPSDTDVVVLSADHPEQIALWVNRFCIDNLIPFVNCGYMNDIAILGPFIIPGETSCFECNDFSLVKGNDKISSLESEVNQGFKIASFAPVNHISASLCANDIIRYLGGYGKPLSLSKRLAVCTNHFETLEVTFTPNKECRCCAKIQKR